MAKGNSSSKPDIFKSEPFLRQGNVDEKSYGKSEILNANTDIIPELDIKIEKVDMSKTEIVDIFDTKKGSGNKQKPPIDYSQFDNSDSYKRGDKPPKANSSSNAIETNTNSSNNGFFEQDEEEQQHGAEQMADMLLGLYDMLNGLSAKVLKIDINKLKDKIRKEGFPLDLLEKYTMNYQGEEVTIQQFISNYNDSVDEEFAHEEKFNKSIRKPLIRLCIKNGWGLTDEQALIFMILQKQIKSWGACLMGKFEINHYVTSCKDEEKAIVKSNSNYSGSVENQENQSNSNSENEENKVHNAQMSVILNNDGSQTPNIDYDNIVEAEEVK